MYICNICNICNVKWDIFHGLPDLLYVYHQMWELYIRLHFFSKKANAKVSLEKYYIIYFPAKPFYKIAEFWTMRQCKWKWLFALLRRCLGIPLNNFESKNRQISLNRLQGKTLLVCLSNYQVSRNHSSPLNVYIKIIFDGIPVGIIWTVWS